MLNWLTGKENPARVEARRVLAAVTAAARRPGLFGPGRTPDTFDGRFEMVTLHAALAMRRLKAAPDAGAVAQEFADLLFASFDEALREVGVGDMSVPRKMKALAGVYFGRLTAYSAGLDAGDAARLAAALSRNIWNADDAPAAPALAAYALAAEAALAERPSAALSDPALWPEPRL